MFLIKISILYIILLIFLILNIYKLFKNKKKILNYYYIFILVIFIIISGISHWVVVKFNSPKINKKLENELKTKYIYVNKHDYKNRQGPVYYDENKKKNILLINLNKIKHLNFNVFSNIKSTNHKLKLSFTLLLILLIIILLILFIYKIYILFIKTKF